MKFLIGMVTLFFLDRTIARELSSEGFTELSHYQPLQDCYTKFLEVPSQLGKKVGKLTIDLKLNKSGEVLAIKENSKKSTIHEDTLNSCLFSSLKKMKFSKEVSGKELEISVTLDFPIKKSAQSTTVSNPGEEGKLTLAGIDINKNGIRDDVEFYIETNITDSMKHREALKSIAAVTQREILSQSKEDSILAAIAGVRSIECLSYLGFRKQGQWKTVEALMVNTPARIHAMDLHNERINGEIFQTLPDRQRRSSCTFNVEALPN